MPLKIFFLGFIFFIVQHTVQCVQCYSCSVGSDGCSSTFNRYGAGVTTPTYSPSSGTAYCGKGVYFTNTNAIFRGPVICTGSAANVTGSTVIGTDSYTLYCCTTDLCNGASWKSLTFQNSLFYSICLIFSFLAF